MAFFNWDAKFSVGVASVDEQHKKLVGMVNTLYDAMQVGKANDVIGKLLSDLITYTKTHFADEEKLMQTNGYPDFAAHKQLHDALTKQVIATEQAFKAGKAPSAVELGKFLKDWLINHIQGTDKKYGPFLNEKGVR